MLQRFLPVTNYLRSFAAVPSPILMCVAAMFREEQRCRFLIIEMQPKLLFELYLLYFLQTL